MLLDKRDLHDVKQFCADRYYCMEDDDGSRALAEEYEWWSPEQVNKAIDNDVVALCYFLEHLNKGE